MICFARFLPLLSIPSIPPVFHTQLALMPFASLIYRVFQLQKMVDKYPDSPVTKKGRNISS